MEAGSWAQAHFKLVRSRWRRRKLPVFLGFIPVLAVGTAALLVLNGIWQLLLAATVGSIVTVALVLWDSPPERIERWRIGAEGERRTAKALRPLEREGWFVTHDLDNGHGNIDHLVIGPGGVFLLDTKTLRGEIGVEEGVLRIQGLDDPSDHYAAAGLPRRLRGVAASLKDEIQARTKIRVWVQPVVVIWGRFPGRAFEADGIAYVHGEETAAWLRSREARLPQARVEAIRGCLSDLAERRRSNLRLSPSQRVPP